MTALWPPTARAQEQTTSTPTREEPLPWTLRPTLSLQETIYYEMFQTGLYFERHVFLSRRVHDHVACWSTLRRIERTLPSYKPALDPSFVPPVLPQDERDTLVALVRSVLCLALEMLSSAEFDWNLDALVLVECAGRDLIERRPATVDSQGFIELIHYRASRRRHGRATSLRWHIIAALQLMRSGYDECVAVSVLVEWLAMERERICRCRSC